MLAGEVAPACCKVTDGCKLMSATAVPPEVASCCCCWWLGCSCGKTHELVPGDALGPLDSGLQLLLLLLLLLVVVVLAASLVVSFMPLMGVSAASTACGGATGGL